MKIYKNTVICIRGKSERRRTHKWERKDKYKNDYETSLRKCEKQLIKNKIGKVCMQVFKHLFDIIYSIDQSYINWSIFNWSLCEIKFLILSLNIYK